MTLPISSGRKAAKALSARWKIAFAIRRAADPSCLLLRRLSPPVPHEELPHLQDSDIWELPCSSILSRSSNRDHLCGILQAKLHEAGLELDVSEALNEVQMLVASPLRFCSIWKLFKEPDFGPKEPEHTVIVLLEATAADESESTKWIQCSVALKMLEKRFLNSERIGLLAANVFCTLSSEDVCCDLQLDTEYLEYPPGMLIVPMVSRTLKPFSHTNLVIWAPRTPSSSNLPSSLADGNRILNADALIVDPGCSAPAHKELAAIVRSLPRNLLVFITHHHLDHTDGLPAVKEANPEAVVIAHDNTLKRLISQLEGINYSAVTGETTILLKGHRLEVVASPGHTDGHLCLFHCSTRTLVAGDHCVGEGSSILDPNSGGNLHDYMSSSYRLLEIGPHLVVPMHGRPNFWPIHMLKGHIKHRQSREAKILKAIDNGATTAFEIVSDAYRQTPISLWPAALLNVRSHVEHLRLQQKLPKDFSFRRYERSFGAPFLLRWASRIAALYVFNSRVLVVFLLISVAYLCNRFLS